jgi:hypothetical protein
MEAPSEKAAPQAVSVDDGHISLQRNVIRSDQSSQLTAATTTSLAAATPRTSRLFSHQSAFSTEATFAPNGPKINGLPCFTTSFTTNFDQFPVPTENAVLPYTHQSSQLDSLLLSKLPRELRDKIYREAVLEDIEIPVHVAHYDAKDGEHRHRLQLEHALMLVCKQTRHEVADIYLLENTFRVTNDLFEPRAIAQLNRALRPWAARTKRLEISHEWIRDQFATADIDFSISVSRDRILVNPQTFVPYVMYEDKRMVRHPTVGKMCYCGILRLAAWHRDDNVVSWVQKYVDVVKRSQSEWRPNVLYCWTCAGFITTL